MRDAAGGVLEECAATRVGEAERASSGRHATVTVRAGCQVPGHARSSVGPGVGSGVGRWCRRRRGLGCRASVGVGSARVSGLGAAAGVGSGVGARCRVRGRARVSGSVRRSGVGSGVGRSVGVGSARVSGVGSARASAPVSGARSVRAWARVSGLGRSGVRRRVGATRVGDRLGLDPGVVPVVVGVPAVQVVAVGQPLERRAGGWRQARTALDPGARGRTPGQGVHDLAARDPEDQGATRGGQATAPGALGERCERASLIGQQQAGAGLDAPWPASSPCG